MANKFKYFRPKTLPEALELLATCPGKILAGGTDLVVQLKRGKVATDCLVDIKGIGELQKLSFIPGQGLFIGAGITVNQLSSFPVVAEKYPALKQAADSLASYQLRNRATVVGNLCNASPAADLAAPLLIYEAVVHVAGTEDARTIPLVEFFSGPKATVLTGSELVTGIFVPDVAAGDRSIYLKQTRIKGHDLGIVGAGVRKSSQGQWLVALSSVAPTPIRLYQLEAELVACPTATNQQLAAKAAELISKYISPISDVRSSAAYRSHIAGVLLKRAILSLGEQEVG